MSGVIALIAVFLSALLVINQARERQVLYTRLNEVQDEREAALGEYSRLLIERWTLSSHARVHRIAESELDLVFPAADAIIEVFDQPDQGQPAFPIPVSSSVPEGGQREGQAVARTEPGSPP